MPFSWAGWWVEHKVQKRDVSKGWKLDKEGIVDPISKKNLRKSGDMVRSIKGAVSWQNR